MAPRFSRIGSTTTKRNEAFNANNFFNNANRSNVGRGRQSGRPVYRYDNPGYTVGGPVIVPGTRFKQERAINCSSFGLAGHSHPQELTAMMQVTFSDANWSGKVTLRI